MATSTRGARPARPFRSAEIQNGEVVAILATGNPIPIGDLTRPELVKVAFATIGTGAGIHFVSKTNPELIRLIRQWCEAKGEWDAGKVPPTVSHETETETATDDDDLDQVLQDLREVVRRKGALDEGAVRIIVADEVAKRVSTPTQVRVGEREPVTITGKTHRQFPDLLRKVSARRNLFLTGSAGVGKTFIVDQIGEALGIPVTTLTADPLPQRFEIIGGVSPVTGDVIKGSVADVYENGGIYLIDEFDTGHPSLGTALNKLLANDSFDFPVAGGGTRKVRKHKDFLVIATGNTYGQGGSLRYVGTNKINGAGLDRFSFVHIGVDEELEKHICDSISPDASAQVLPIVRTARRNAETYRLDVIVSPRTSIDACHFIVAGDTLRQALDGRLFGRGLPSDQEAKLLEGVSL